MNLISSKPGLQSNEEWKLIKDFREVDYNNFVETLKELFENFSKLSPDFSYNLKIESRPSEYLGSKESRIEVITIDAKDGPNEIKGMNIKLPQLMQGNYFIIDGILYVPLLFLERVLIDHIVKFKGTGEIDTKKTHIVLTLMPTLILFINYHENFVKIRNKTCSIDEFYSALFSKDISYLEKLKEEGTITEIIPLEECSTKVLKLFNINKDTWFVNNDMSLEEFIDNILIINHYKNMFQDFYGFSTIRDILKETKRYSSENISIDMSDGSNRRVVLYEYLTQPFYEYYLRMVKEFVNKNEKQNPLKTMNNNVLITTGFNKLMHRGQQFNTSLPYLLPTINKISQDILIIKEGRIPKTWTSCHPSMYKKICSISVSAQNMGSNLVFTSETRLNKFGRIEGTNEVDPKLSQYGTSLIEEDTILGDIIIEEGSDD